MQEYLRRLLRISQSIGLSLDMDKMLEKALLSYHKELGCMFCAVISCEVETDPVNVLSCMPRESRIFPILNDIENTIHIENTIPYFAQTHRPFTSLDGLTDNGQVFHLFRIPDTGLLVLAMGEKPLDVSIRTELEPVNKKLAEACRNCRAFNEVNCEIKRLQADAEDLRRSMETFSLAFGVSKQGLCDFNLSEGSLFMSPEVYEILGFSPCEFPNTLEEWRKRIHPEDQKKNIFSLRSPELINDSFETIYRIKNRQGQWIWIQGKGGIVEKSHSGDPKRILSVISDITNLKNFQKQMQGIYRDLYQSANTDHLTGLLNRQRFYVILNEEMDRSARYSSPLSIIMLDIDHFKEVNDTFGHQTGDRILEQLAEIIQSRVRKTDKTGRWGGDEFMILVLGDVASAITIAEDLREATEASDFDIPFDVTVSLGIAHYRSTDDQDSFITRVDDALYRAKAKGRNIIVTETGVP